MSPPTTPAVAAPTPVAAPPPAGDVEVYIEPEAVPAAAPEVPSITSEMAEPAGSESLTGAPRGFGGGSKVVGAAIVTVIIIIAAVSGAVLMGHLGDGDDEESDDDHDNDDQNNNNHNNNTNNNDTEPENTIPADATEITDEGAIAGEVPSEGTNLYYKVELEEGDVLNLGLDASGSSDYDLVVYQGLTGDLGTLVDGSFEEGGVDEELEFTAYEDGWYLVEVFAYDGTGDFNLTVEFGEPVELDDGNNSFDTATLIEESTTVESDVDEFYDFEDYYKVYMEPGMVLDVELEVPQDCDFDLWIFGPDEELIDWSEVVYGSEEVKVEIEEAGWYYIDVFAYEGSGDYAMHVLLADTTPTDDDNSFETAQAVEPGTYTDTLDEYNDPDDYYEVYLEVGQVMTATLSFPADVDYDLWLLDENYIIYFDESSYTEDNPEVVTFTPFYDAYYYLNPSAWEGSGEYTLTVTISGEGGVPVAVIEASDSKVEVGEIVTFDGSSSTGTGTMLLYDWDLGDGAVSTEETVDHAYGEAGVYTVSLTVDDGTFTVTATVSVEVVAPSAVTSKYAVVVGISDYLDNKDLEYCDEDAESWTAYLQDEGYTVHTLIDSEATKAAILAEIEWMESVEDENSYCVFTYSGHGGYDDMRRESTICPYDTSQTSWSYDIYDSELEEAFEGFESSHIFIFFDSCHSGGMDSVAGAGRYVSQTCGEDELGYDAPRFEHGEWTYWFLVWGILGQGLEEMTEVHDAAYDNAASDSAFSPMHPEEEYAGTEPFVL